MEKQISRGLKYTFLAHGITGLIFGLTNLLIPQQFYAMMGTPITEPTPFRMMGAAIVAFATTSWLAYRETDWDRVKIVVVMEMVWPILGTLVMLLSVIFRVVPVQDLANAIILAGFAACFTFFYVRR
jgi:hypothetical protein